MAESPLPTGTVTFLFTDIEESTGLVRRVGNEAFAEVRAAQRRFLRDAFAAHGGHEIDTAGDGFFVVFDSAREAVRAAIESQLALAGHDWPEGAEVRVRMGLHTAEPHLGEEGYVGVGVHRASRICDAGHGGQVLLSNATAGIVEDAELDGVELIDLGEHRLKGLPVAQRLFELSAPGLRSRFGAPRTGSATGTPGAGTFLFADLGGWRYVIQAVGDEASAVLTAEYHVVATSIVEAYGGAVLELVADTVLAVFSSASDALRGAVELRAARARARLAEGCDVTLSMALHSGRWSGDPRRPSAGTALYRVSCLARTCGPDQTLVSATTAALAEGDHDVPALRSLGVQTIRTLEEPAHLYELESD